MAWTSLADEATLYETLVDTGRIAVDVVGESVQGRPIRLVRVGDPPAERTERAAVLFVGLQHGNEPAGREGLLRLIEELCTSGDETVSAFLADHAVFAVPTVNPDRLDQTRNNAAGANLNRENLSLAQPESEALGRVYGWCRPLVSVDAHEFAPGANNNPNRDVLFSYPDTIAPADQQLTGVSAALKAALHAAAEDLEWTHGDYHSPEVINHEGVLHNTAALRHCVSVLIESNRTRTDAVRAAVQHDTLRAALVWTMANVAGLADTVAAAAARKTAEGADAAGPFVTRTAVIDPVPYAYQLTPSQAASAAEHLAVFDIAVGDDLTVTMGQPGQPVIPYLLDGRTAAHIVAAVPIYDAPEPPPPPVQGDDTLPVGHESPTITWHGCDLVTGRIIADLPEVNGTISRLLGAYTSSHLSVPIPLSGPAAIGDVAFQATTPGRTMIVAVVNGQPCWGGLVLTRQAGTGATMELGVSTLESYLVRRRVRDHAYRQVDEARIMAGLLGDAGTILGVGQGIGLEIDAPPTGTLRDRSYLARERATVYDRVRQLMAVTDGPEVTIEILWGDETRTWFRKIARVRKRIGIATDRPTAIFETTAAAVFSSTGASETTYQLTEDYSDGRGANYVIAYSSGEGDDQPASAPAIDRATLDAGWPIYERVFMPSSSITDVAVLDDHARQDLALRRHGAITWEIATRWDASPRLNIDWRLGDDVGWIVTGHRHPGGITGQGRGIGWELDSAAGLVTPLLLDPYSDTEEA